MQVPVRVLCTEVMCRVTVSTLMSVSGKSIPVPRPLGWAGTPGRWGGPPVISGGGECVVVLEAGWGCVSITEDEMRWPCRRWRRLPPRPQTKRQGTESAQQPHRKLKMMETMLMQACKTSYFKKMFHIWAFFNKCKSVFAFY